MSIDPEKLLTLIKERHHDGGVTLGYPTMVKIVEGLRERDDHEQARTALEETLGQVKAERDEMAAHVERLHDDFNALVSESYGVAELHANGDVAPWDELTRGGRFEQWLLSFSDKPTTSLANRDDRLADAIERAAGDRAQTDDCPRYEAGMKIAASMVRHWHKEAP